MREQNRLRQEAAVVQRYLASLTSAARSRTSTAAARDRAALTVTARAATQRALQRRSLN